MKFGKQLAQMEQNFPAPWRGTMLKYAPLKDRIKQCSQPGPESCEGHEHDEAFFRELEAEVDRINRQFETNATATLEAYRSLDPTGKCATCFCFARGKKKINLSNGVTMEATPEIVAQYSQLCIHYAKANAVAVRKIIKKHDKHCHSRKGGELLAKFWTDQTGRFSFLHSPLLFELAAVHLTALEAKEGPMDIATSPNSAGSNTSTTTSVDPIAPQPGTADIQIEDLRCPICLSRRLLSGGAEVCTDANPCLQFVEVCNQIFEVLLWTCAKDIPFKPISLTCSHIFCEDCLLKACGKGRTLGPTRAILNSISSESQCPECRQTDVFANAIILSETAKMLQSRHPGYWAKRGAEVKRYQQELRSSYEKQKEAKMKGLRGFHPSYLIYS